ncbi:Calcium-dependent secretion activator 1, partial [Ophiophagus hannah]
SGGLQPSSRSGSSVRPSSPSPSVVSEKEKEELERLQKEEEERKKKLQLYVFVMRCIAYPFNAKQPTDMARRQQKETRPAQGNIWGGSETPGYGEALPGTRQNPESGRGVGLILTAESFSKRLWAVLEGAWKPESLCRAVRSSLFTRSSRGRFVSKRERERKRGGGERVSVWHLYEVSLHSKSIPWVAAVLWLRQLSWFRSISLSMEMEPEQKLGGVCSRRMQQEPRQLEGHQGDTRPRVHGVVVLSGRGGETNPQQDQEVQSVTASAAFMSARGQMTYCLSWLLFPWWPYITTANAKKELAFCSNLRMPKEKKSSELEGGSTPFFSGFSWDKWPIHCSPGDLHKGYVDTTHLLCTCHGENQLQYFWDVSQPAQMGPAKFYDQRQRCLQS